MRIELDADFRAPTRRTRRKKPVAKGAKPGRISRHERTLRRIALAQHIEHLVSTGQVESYAEIALMCGVSRARVSQVVSSFTWDS